MPSHNVSFDISISTLFEKLGMQFYVDRYDISYVYKPRVDLAITMEDTLLNDVFLQLLQQMMQENYIPCVLLQVESDPRNESFQDLSESILEHRPAILKYKRDYFYVNPCEQRIEVIPSSTKWYAILMQQAVFVPNEMITAPDALLHAINQVLPRPLFVTSGDVDIGRYYLSKNFIGQKKEQLMTLGLDNDHVQAYSVVMLTAIAAKLYFSQRDMRVGAPSIRVPFEELQKNYNELVALHPENTDANLPHAGNKVVNYFLEDIRINCPAYNHKSFVEEVAAHSFIGKISKELQLYDTLDRPGVVRWYGESVPAKFNCYKVKQLCYKIEKEHQIVVKNYLNLFGGWGYMLLGALATPSIKRYIDTDPNTLLYQPKRLMWQMFGPAKQVMLHQLPMEDLTQEQLTPNNQPNELVFYSPPYFDMERYQDQNNNQGRIVYASYESWFDNILLKSIEVSYHAMATPGILAVHIGSVSSQGKLYATPTELQQYMRQISQFFEYCGELTYCPKININSRGTSFIYLYKKLNYSEPFYLAPFERQSLQDETLQTLQQVVQSLKQFEAVQAYYHVSNMALFAAVSAWDNRISFNHLLTLTALPENAGLKLSELNASRESLLLQLKLGELYQLVKEENNSFKLISNRLGIDLDRKDYAWIKKLTDHWCEDNLRMNHWYDKTVREFMAAGTPRPTSIPAQRSTCSATLFQPSPNAMSSSAASKPLSEESNLLRHANDDVPLSPKKTLRLFVDPLTLDGIKTGDAHSQDITRVDAGAKRFRRLDEKLGCSTAEAHWVDTDHRMAN